MILYELTRWVEEEREARSKVHGGKLDAEEVWKRALASIDEKKQQAAREAAMQP